MLKIKSFKFAQLALLFSCACSTSVFANQEPLPTPIIDTVQEADLLTRQQLELETKAIEAQLAAEKKLEEERLAAEKQALAEQTLTDKLGQIELQFKSTVAKIYADNDFQLLWQDKATEQQFLREYAALVLSGISKQASTILEHIDSTSEGSFERDALLTDTFLDYMYYANNVSKSAQKWLYSANNYKPALPRDEQIHAWLSAVAMGKSADFLTSLSTQNPLYRQTIAQLPSLFNAEGMDNDKLAQLYKIAINAQRLRVIPAFDNGLFVNIPSYQLHYYRDGKLILTSKVIVGKKARKTPVLYSKLSDVVVNPPWNTPTRLINEDIIPRVRKDPSYIYRNGYTIIDSKGKTIDPYTIDWENMTAKKFPYRLRQAPGDSALGNFKFNMPSSDAIYLHDTPSRGLFAKKDLALSSGCVRVEKADELASVLLKEAGWSEERKVNTVKSRKTISVNVASNNPVFLYYVTAWVNNGKTHTLPDIYGYDVTPNLSYINWSIVKKYLN
ncbi:Murein L,D-transpeptidase YcbB/YkuD [Pasteurella multocida]|uniref:L,D-transpeptidase family protein n=1 Tax=Pasteurella multocida TaxID=747 RepID=UPI0008E0E7EE|nr:murein L,D-transpeptidase [Pasteurella multocida]SFP03909.1 Murein L,D-transpeptidase YcbB/YkuD [Pasteurella multocida]VEE38588.1 putative L,D-transpeptidase 7 [Pasteurella multocida subsp. gallicida]